MRYFVTIAEFATGIVRNRDGSRFLGSGEYRIPFDQEQEALTFARHHFETNPEHECLVIDEAGREIATMRPTLGISSFRR